MEILEHGNQRALLGEGLEEAPHGPRRLPGWHRPFGGPDRPEHAARDHIGPLVIVQQRQERRARIAAPEASDDVGERPIGDALSVGDATAQHCRRLAHACAQLAHEP